jgi:DNA polymerase-3 subunit alpha/error-prone DNA polymerase
VILLYQKKAKSNAFLSHGKTIGVSISKARPCAGDYYAASNVTNPCCIINYPPRCRPSGCERIHLPTTIGPLEYFHDVWEQLGETYGVMVYQEDVIKIALHYAGLPLPTEIFCVVRAFRQLYKK